jgi:hypothetical protein
MFTQLVDPALINPRPQVIEHQPDAFVLARERQRLDEIQKLARLRAARLAQQIAGGSGSRDVRP